MDLKVIDIHIDDIVSEDIHKLPLIKDCRLVRLETTEDALIGKIDRVETFGRYIYVADYSKSKAIFIFDSLGNYLNKIDRRGRSGDEYLQLSGMWVDTVHRTLNLISRRDKKQFVYDLEGKNLLTVKKVPKAFKEVKWNPKYWVGYSGNYTEDKENPFNIWVLDTNNNIKNGIFEINSGWESISFSDGRVLSAYQDEIYYMRPMDFNMYRINPEKQWPVAYYFGKYKWPDSTMSYNERLEMARKNDQLIDRIYWFQETKDFVFITFLFKGQMKGMLYDKSSGKVDICELSSYTGKYFIPFGEIVSLDERCMINVVRASAVKRCCEGDEYNNFEEVYPEQVSRMKTIFPGIDESDNPFLVFYNF